ncbi:MULTISPECIES: hypothetical protein [Streptomyces]|nr:MULTISPECIES: hypothetical protein [Streptomyces]
MGGSRSTIVRRVMVEVLPEKAISGARYQDLASKYSVNAKSL